MKNLIIIVGTIILGCFIFGMMVTNHDSLYYTVQEHMVETLSNMEEMVGR